jgi:hypothetical protein
MPDHPETLFSHAEVLLNSLRHILMIVIAKILPWTALIAWVAFWLLAVNWVKFRQVLVQGGLIGLVLIGLCMILLWGLIAPPADGAHYLFGLTLSNFAGKTVYVTSLFCIMFLCGSVQLSGCCSSLCRFEEDEPAKDAVHAH